jgi:hypothetical protein
MGCLLVGLLVVVGAGVLLLGGILTYVNIELRSRIERIENLCEQAKVGMSEAEYKELARSLEAPLVRESAEERWVLHGDGMFTDGAQCTAHFGQDGTLQRTELGRVD